MFRRWFFFSLFICASLHCTKCLGASANQDSHAIDVAAYNEIKRECYHFIYSVQRDMDVWEWPDALVKELLKMNLKDYLVGYLNTPESRALHLKYEELDWNIHEMMKIHLAQEE